jgi:hypothetical protein
MGTKTGEAELPKLGNACFQPFRHMDLTNIPFLVTGPAKHMGYWLSGSYGLCSKFPTFQLGKWNILWVIREYGL